MNDRLAELRRGAPPPADDGAVGLGTIDVEMGTQLTRGAASTSAQPGGTFMAAFFAEIAKIKATMAIIRGNIRLIEQHHGQCLTAISVEQGKASNEKLEVLMEATNGAAGEVRNKLKAMDASNKEMMKRDPGSSEVRIRCYQHGTLTRRFVELMSEYQAVQSKYKHKYRERVERQYKIVKPEATREEIEHVLEGDAQQEIFTQQILQQPGHAAAKNALADIQERHRDIHRLEQSIAELHQLFLDMSVLVESQARATHQAASGAGCRIARSARASVAPSP
jgi:t-SNARE complex subunit (syntaxin)